MQADGSRVVGCKWPLGRRCGAVRKVCTVTGPYCEECEDKSGSREHVNDESGPSHIKSGRATGEGGFAGERGDAETEQGHWESVYC